MKILRTSAAACLCAGVALAVTSPATTACGGKCELPDERIDLVLPMFVATRCEDTHSGIVTILEGVARREGASLVLHSAVVDEDFVFPDLDVAIPDGTFVTAAIVCESIPGYPLGKLLLIQNLPEIGGEPNPTEDGERTWLFVAAGGSLPIVAGLPADFAFEQVCEVQSANGRSTYGVNALVLAADKDVVLVPPEETRPFTIHRGSQAGAYSVENVNITYQSGAIPVAVNFRITRAD